MNFEEMYKAMVKEVYDAHVIQFEHGFIQFQMDLTRKIISIQEVYIEPEHRKGYRGLYWQMADAVCDQGREFGCVKLVGRIEQTNPNKDALMACYFRYGMRHSHNVGNDMWYFKEIA